MPTIQTRYDRKRGCGWRKPGGIYLVSSGLAAPCGALPIPLCRCPTCGNGIKATRGWTWIDAGALLSPAVALCDGPPALNPDRFGQQPTCIRCPMSRISGRHGLLWVGGQFYKTPEDFTREAMNQGVSRRISQLPKDLKLGETWVFIAHREAIEIGRVLCERGEPGATPLMDGKYDRPVYGPAVFHAFKPTAVEYVVNGSESDEEVARLEKRGLTLVRIERVEEQPEQPELVEAVEPAPGKAGVNRG